MLQAGEIESDLNVRAVVRLTPGEYLFHGMTFPLDIPNTQSIDMGNGTSLSSDGHTILPNFERPSDAPTVILLAVGAIDVGHGRPVGLS